MTDADWALSESQLDALALLGRTHTTDVRDVVDALQYMLRAASGWRMLPVHFKPWQTIN